MRSLSTGRNVETLTGQSGTRNVVSAKEMKRPQELMREFGKKIITQEKTNRVRIHDCKRGEFNASQGMRHKSKESAIQKK